MGSRYTLVAPTPLTTVPHPTSHPGPSHQPRSLQTAVNTPDRVKALFPGLWYSIHLQAAMAVDARGMAAYEQYMTLLSQHFPCDVCKPHLQSFLRANPTSRYRSMKNSRGAEIGMATHSWMLHNDVNHRIGKPHMDWATFEQLWLSEEAVEMAPCTKNCGH